jgi:ATP-dependent Zn protease
VNVAALKAARDKASVVSQVDVEYAKDRIMMGAERKSAFITPENRNLTAYHEGGHALVAMLTQGALPVHKATIMPRGQALGMVMQLPDKDDKSMTRRQLNAMLDVCMGGRVAEEMIFGGDDVTTGASQDLSSATRIAHAMVTQYGFSERVGLQMLSVRPGCHGCTVFRRYLILAWVLTEWLLESLLYDSCCKSSGKGGMHIVATCPGAQSDDISRSTSFE